MRQAAAPVGLTLAGVAVLLLWGHETAGVAVTMTLIGIACVIAVSLVFLAVGRSEDAERAAAAAALAPQPEPPPVDPHAGEATRRSRPRPPRRPT
jgi:hypothetical protein